MLTSLFPKHKSCCGILNLLQYVCEFENGGKYKATSCSQMRKEEIIAAVERQPNKKTAIVANEFQIPPSTLTAFRRKKPTTEKCIKSSVMVGKRCRPAKFEGVDQKVFDWISYARCSRWLSDSVGI